MIPAGNLAPINPPLVSANNQVGRDEPEQGELMICTYRYLV